MTTAAPSRAARARRAVVRALERRGVTLALGLALVLSLPAVFSGYATEDWLFRAATRLPFEWSNLNLYDARDVKDGVAVARAVGTLPWLTPDDFRISFWRPLSSLTHHFDYRLFPVSPAVAHLHSLLYYLACVAAVGALMRRLIAPAWVAGLAVVLYAIDDAHGVTVGWISNRHVVMATALSVLSLWAHDRLRRDGWRPGAWLSPSSLAVALTCSEAAVGALGYFVAYALLLDREPRRRWFAIVPVLAVGATWAIAFRALGHGAVGSGLYIDPWLGAGDFLRALPERAGVLLLGQLGAPPSDRWHLVGATARLALATGGYLLFALVLGVTWRDRRARFFALGMVLSLVPLAATFPSDRGLMLSGIGGFGLVAVVIEKTVTRGAARGLGAGLLLLHAGWAPLVHPKRSLAMAELSADMERASSSAYGGLHAFDERLVVLNAPDFYFCKMLREIRWTRWLPAPGITCIAGSVRVTLTRLDPNAISVEVHPDFLDRPFNRLFRAESRPMRVGDTVWLATSVARVEAVDAEGAPTRATFRFIWPLESPKLRFVRLSQGNYVAVSPPAVGQTLVLDGS